MEKDFHVASKKTRPSATVPEQRCLRVLTCTGDTVGQRKEHFEEILTPVEILPL